MEYASIFFLPSETSAIRRGNNNLQNVNLIPHLWFLAAFSGNEEGEALGAIRLLPTLAQRTRENWAHAVGVE
jgi:hypothetical protein